MLTLDESRELLKPSGFKTWVAIAGDWLAIFLFISLIHFYPNPLTYLISIFMIARYQLALAILMHDGAHGRLFKSPAWNNYVGQIFLASPILFSQDSYRVLHLKHHRDPLEADDPDLSLTGGYPISKKSFVRKLLRDLSGMSYFKFIRYFVYMARKPKKKAEVPFSTKPIRELSLKMPIWQVAVFALLMNAILIAGFYFSGRPGDYFFLWLLPMMTVLQVLLRIRGITEHAGYGPSKDQRLNTRTLINPFQTYFFAPHYVNYHVEHHVYPNIPCFNLPRVHQLMKERGSLPQANLFTSYRDVLKELIVP